MLLKTDARADHGDRPALKTLLEEFLFGLLVTPAEFYSLVGVGS